MRNERRKDAKIQSYTVNSSHQISVVPHLRLSKKKKKKKTQHVLPLSSKLPSSPPAPPPKSLASFSPNTLLNHLETSMGALQTPEREEISKRMQHISKQTLHSQRHLSITNQQIPDAKLKTKKFTQTLEAADTPTRDEMFSAVKHAHHKNQKPMVVSSKKPPTHDSVDRFAF